MGEKDISEKILLDYNDVFVDVINVCVFDGNEIVKADDLEKTSVHSEYRAADGKVHEEERDIAKYWKQKQSAIALYGIENQSEVDYTMPFRIIGYDGASYRSQILEKRKKIVPVASFVLYFAWLTEKQLGLFKSDFGIVANFFVQKRKNKNYVPDDKREIRHVDAVLKLLSVMTKDDSYRNILYEEDGNKAEVKTMCEVAERLKNQGKSEGRIEGRREGREETRRIIVENMLNQSESIEKICQYIGCDEAYVEAIRKVLYR